ncbi:MAG TPA: assimilatory sulfite reductase (NADPH) hemoprotein subunit [Xanthomonadales bacterium]|nr:assimilatory sulfite reductase (NADPH) hemoprotein subunit [Xanthomonadales bacterium]
MSTDPLKLTPVEGIKARSDYLRGTLAQSLADDVTGAIADDDTQVSKFHGIYQQDDRDVREDRRRQMLEPDYQFMIRARVPGGVCTPEQWLTMDAIARRWANNSVRITTRQAFQFHGVLKHNLKSSIRTINRALLDTIAACGDVNRNVMVTTLPEQSAFHREVFEHAKSFSDHLTPNTTAYHEIWLNDGNSRRKVEASRDSEPIYGETYLPRKFKTAFAIPPRNDVDVFAHDLGYIAIRDGAEGGLAGFNVTVAGGMGATHGDPNTYPRLADVLGFCTPDQVNEVGKQIVSIQRDFGDRTERRHARFKYTVADRGLDWLHDELEKRLGYRLQQAREFSFTHTGDLYGWQRTDDGLWNLALFIENGRVADKGIRHHLTGLRKIAKIHKGEFRLTPNQNLVIAGVHESDRVAIDHLVRAHGLDDHATVSPLRLNSMACVGFPTCALAMAESERYLPELVCKIENLLEKHNLTDQGITIRMTGCPNGCARPYLAEIGLVGKGPGMYNLHLGAAWDGSRLNQIHQENIGEEEVLISLDKLFSAYSAKRLDKEHFGNFLFRTGVIAANESHRNQKENAS